MNPAPNGHCVAYTKTGAVCGRPAVMVDEQRGGPTCLIHAPMEAKYRAYHEAGHLVASYALGFCMPEATIHWRGDTGGWVYVIARPEVLSCLVATAGHDAVERAVNGDEAARQALLAHKVELIARDPKAREMFARNDDLTAVAVMAGPVAQYRGIRWGEWAVCGGEHDFNWIETAFNLESRSKSQHEQVWRELRFRADRILDMQWPAVRAFTKAFLEKVDLGHNEIGEILARSFRRAPVPLGRQKFRP